MTNLQPLINSGAIWKFEGAAGRAAMDAIESGRAILGPELVHDYWGNVIPGRNDVEPGTKGSLGYANAIRIENGLEPLTEPEFDAGEGESWVDAEDEDYFEDDPRYDHEPPEVEYGQG